MKPCALGRISAFAGAWLQANCAAEEEFAGFRRLRGLGDTAPSILANLSRGEPFYLNMLSQSSQTNELIQFACEPMLKSPPECLDVPYAEATLEDHLEFQKRLRAERSQWSQSVRAFLGATDEQLFSQSMSLANYELPNLHRALRRAFPNWQLAFERGLWSADTGDIYPPKYRWDLVAPKRKRCLLVEGTRFFELPGGARRVVMFDIHQSYTRTTLEFRLTGCRDERGVIHRELSRLQRFLNRGHFLRRQAVRPGGAILRLDQPVTWHDLALPSRAKELIRQNTVGVLQRREAFRRNQAPLRRGVLLYGPPGTGKTMIGKILAHERLATFVWVTAADIRGEPGRVRSTFKLARRLRPTILFFEDLDLFASDRSHYGNSAVLGELLCQMDGLEENDGLIIVATTNDLSAIEPAIKDRPNRFDLAIEIGLPDDSARREIVVRAWQKASVQSDLIARTVEGSRGLTCAQVREIAISVLQQAIFRDAIDDELVAQPTFEDVDAAIGAVSGKTVRRIGF